MQVELKDHVGINLRTKQRSVVKGQQRVYVDGVGVGYIGTHPHAKLCFIPNHFSDAEIEQIKRDVALLRGVPRVESVIPAAVPPELLGAKDDGIEPDDFDT